MTSTTRIYLGLMVGGVALTHYIFGMVAQAAGL